MAATPAMLVLLIGADGMLGRAWLELLERRGVEHRTVLFPTIDLSDPASIERVVSSEFGTVINCAAATDVDGAEDAEHEATAINGIGVGHLAKLCARAGSLLVHYSTDYVFDGEASVPYATDHPRSPINAYGRSKAVGEMLIEDSGCQHLLIRTSWLYAPWAQNFVRTMARLAGERDDLRIVNDQRGRATSVEHLASASWALIETGARGTFHVTDGGDCSWYEFGLEVVRHVNPDCRVNPCTTLEFPRPARRPAYSVLDLSKTEEAIGPMPGWTANLAGVVPRLER